MSDNAFLSLLLRSDGYWQISKAMFQILECPYACMYLTDMITRQLHWKRSRQLDHDGYFYIRASVIEAELKISKDKRQAISRSLVSRKFVLVKRKGHPCRNYYKVNFEEIAKALQSVDNNDLFTDYDDHEDLDCGKAAVQIAEKPQSGKEVRLLRNRTPDYCETALSSNKEIRTKNKDLMAADATAPALAPKKKPPSSEEGEATKAAIAHYCDEYKSRYKASPPITGRAAGILKTTVKEFGLEKAKAMISAYLSMADSWFLTKSHDLETFRGNLNKVSQYMQNGIQVSRADIRQHELASHNQAVIDRFLARRGSDES